MIKIRLKNKKGSLVSFAGINDLQRQCIFDDPGQEVRRMKTGNVIVRMSDEALYTKVVTQNFKH